jgi:hypothetical protein
VRRTSFLLFLLLPGCIGLSYDRQKIGTAKPIVDARRLKPGATTLPEAITKLGPPDLLLRAGFIDRAYWVSSDRDYFRLDVSFSLRDLSWDAFIMGLGSEDFRMARLEFNREGVLQTMQITDFESSRSGQYVAIDSRVVSQFIEDRSRLLHLIETDDDDEDVELDKPK